MDKEVLEIMGENSKIEWTHHTFNPWSGCTKVSAECDRCYAEVNYSVKMRGVQWGKYGNRIIKADSGWKDPLKWNKAAEALGVRRRVFCASLADVFEGNESMPESAHYPVYEARLRVAATIKDTPWLDWLLLTKRPENVPFITAQIFPATQINLIALPNVWIGTSVGVRKTIDRIDALRQTCAPVKFLSIEPLLEDLGELNLSRVDWVIIGGESGSGARPCNIEWMRSILRQAKEQGCKVFVKQLGELPIGVKEDQPYEFNYGATKLNMYAPNTSKLILQDKKGGDITEFPLDLQIREFPEVAR